MSTFLPKLLVYPIIRSIYLYTISYTIYILSLLFRSFLIHGHIYKKLLTCALSPIVKDSTGDIASSKNYNAIAISSLILKIFDICILILIGHCYPMMNSNMAFNRTAPPFNVHGQYKRQYLII